MSKKTIIPLAVAAGVIIIGAAAVGHAWSMRDTSLTMRRDRKAVNKELSNCKPEEVLAYLEKLSSEKSLHTWFVPDSEGNTSAWQFWALRFGNKTRVSYDYIAQLIEEQFIRFAGDGAEKLADVSRLKELLAFSDKFIKTNVLSDAALASLKERRLDGFFLSGDFDGAIAYLEGEGVPKRSLAWCKSTAAKLRAHKAMENGDKKEAVTQLQVFIDFMLSDEQKDFEDCDPTTGIVYSREWVVARNYMRCSTMCREVGNTALADKFLADAKKYFAPALEKAKDDRKSYDSLQAEMKSYGL